MIKVVKKIIRNWLKKEIISILEEIKTSPNIISIKSNEGGEIIIPNMVRQAFDEGKIKSIKDII